MQCHCYLLRGSSLVSSQINPLSKVTAGNGCTGIPRKGCWEHATAVLIILAACVLRMYCLPSQSVWSDEYVSVAYLDVATWSDFKAGYRQHDPFMPPLYHVSLYWWARLVGDGAIALRCLSLGLGLASLCMMYILGRSLLGGKGALFALALFAFSPQQIYHAQGIRCYSFVVFFALVSAHAFWRMLHYDGMRWWIINAAAGMLLVWTHLGGVLLVAVWGVGALLWLRRQWSAIVLWGGFQALSMLPLAAQVLTTMHYQSRPDVGNTALSNPVMLLVGMITPFFKDTAYVMDALPTAYLIDAGLISVRESMLARALVAASFLLAVFFLISVVSVLKQIVTERASWFLRTSEERKSIPGAALSEAEQQKGETSAMRFLLLWFLMPALMLYVPVVLVNSAALVPRYTIFASPSLHLLVAGSVIAIRKPKRMVAWGAGIIILMMIFGLSTTILPIRGNYLALGQLLETGYDGQSVAVLGDSPLLASQVAYNSTLPADRIVQVYSLKEISLWLDKELMNAESVWFVLEETEQLEDPIMLPPVEHLFMGKGVEYSRHFFYGPQLLLAYHIRR